MNIMKSNIITMAAAVLLSGAMASCTLDAYNHVEKSIDSFSLTDASQLLTGVYENLNKAITNPEKTFLYVSILASDDCFGGGGGNDQHMQACDLLRNSGADMTRQFWIDRYEGIQRANNLIYSLEEKADELKANDTDEYNRIMGEAKFLRGFYLYELASMYGNVPVQTNPKETVLTAASTQDEWAQVMQDLYDACKLLPERFYDGADAGHVGRGAAQGMLARAWLFYTGMFCNGFELKDMTSTTYNPDAITSVKLPDGTELTKQMVIDEIDKCVASGKYSLVGDFRELWAYTNNYTVNDVDWTRNANDIYGNHINLTWAENDAAANPETLFSIKFNKQGKWSDGVVGYANRFTLFFGVRGGQDYANTFPFGQGWGSGPVAPNLVSEWETTEPKDTIRLKGTVLNWTDGNHPNYTHGGWSDFIQETDYYNMKLAPVSAKENGNYVCCFENLMYGRDGWQEGSDNYQMNNIHDIVLLRYADVLLMQSELKKDATGLNKVRARAGLPAVGYSLDAIQKERRHELALEGERWNDMRRWHIAAAALDQQLNQPTYYCGQKSTNKKQEVGYSDRYNATAGFFKIPETEISLSNGKIKQNPGWDDASANYNAWKN